MLKLCHDLKGAAYCVIVESANEDKMVSTATRGQPLLKKAFLIYARLSNSGSEISDAALCKQK